MAEHPVSPVPIRLNDDELVALGAFLRGDGAWAAETKAQAIATVGMKLTKFFMDVARTAVEHYDRDQASASASPREQTDD